MTDSESPGRIQRWIIRSVAFSLSGAVAIGLTLGMLAVYLYEVYPWMEANLGPGVMLLSILTIGVVLWLIGVITWKILDVAIIDEVLLRV